MKKFITSSVLVASLLMFGACNNDMIENGPKEGSSSPNESKVSENNNNNSVDYSQEHKFKRVSVELSRVIDGDTIEVIYNDHPEKVRFLLVDTPETSHPRLGKQPFGQEAKLFTKQLIENGANIELEFDIGQNRDKYNRLLAYIYVDNKMVQEELLKNGLARVAYIYPPNTRYVDTFTELQKQAQQKAINIWSIENYVQDDGFQSSKKEDTVDAGDNPKDNKCSIKGNISSNGNKIFHTQDSPWYDRTNPEEWFCTEEEAIKAGYRSAQF